MKLLALEKVSRIIKLNHFPNTVKANTKPGLQEPHLHIC